MQSSSLGNQAARRASWIALLTGATIFGSFIFACATPFPALGALAALHMNRRDAFALTGINWAANQIIGYGFLHYPQSLESFAWGAWIGMAALAATAAAIATESFARRAGRLASAVPAFVIAVATYECVLYVATVFLPSEPGAFGFKIVLYIVEVNAFAFAGLIILQRIGRMTGIAAQREHGTTRTA
jgi:hypothetical protein